MGSLNLPPELKLSIAENLDPISSFNFAITCKEHWKLCDPINRRHARLFAENRTIDTADAGRLLWDKLKEILDDHRVGWYLRDLSLPSNRQTYWDESVGHDFQLTGQTLKPPEEDLIRYYRAVEDVEERYGTEMLTKLYWKGKWEAGLGNGAEEPIINILVHHLPHLKVFRVTDAEISTSFYGLMRFIAEGYCEPALAPNLPFQHLNTVAIAHHDSEMSVDAEWCHFFCSIPTVQNFVAHAMGGEMLFDFRERIPRSNVRELVFQYCRFDAGALESILMNTPKLERFSYDIAGATVSEEVYSTWPKKVLQSLVENVSDSLEHLVFEADDAGDDFDNEVRYTY
jgi:hypothetical protein